MRAAQQNEREEKKGISRVRYEKNSQAESTLRIKRVIIIYEIKMNIYDNF